MKFIYDEMELDPAAVLYGLYHNTKAVGMGVLHDKADFSLQDAQEIIAERASQPVFNYFEFDYVCGRPLKVAVDSDSGIVSQRSIALYERDAGSGAFAKAIEIAMEHTN